MNSRTITRRILFLHGLESGPKGTKAKRLASAYPILAPDMCLKQHKSIRTSKPLQVFSAVVLVSSAACLAVLSPIATLTVPKLAIVCISLGAIWFVGYKLARATVAARMLEGSVAIQAKAIQEFKPDVIVGSSWGGAVGVELIRRRIWKGPSVLLAPAYHKVLDFSSMFQRPPRQSLAQMLDINSLSQGIVIVHGTKDVVVPPEDSYCLCGVSNKEAKSSNNGPLRLYLFDDHHNLNQIATSEKFQEWIEEAVTLHSSMQPKA